MRRSISLVVQILIVAGAATSVEVMLGLDARAENHSPTCDSPPLPGILIHREPRYVRALVSRYAGLRETRRLNVPDSSLRISFLELNGFRLELIEFKDSVSSAAIRSKFPAVDDQAKVQGFGKLAFAVTKSVRSRHRFKSKKVKFVREVMHEKDTGEIWFMIEDADGNWLQFFEVRT